MTASASSRRPGFSYLVGLTECVMRRFRNLNEAGSWGGDAIFGRPRNDEYEGGTCGLSVGGRECCCEDGRDEFEACGPGAGEPDRDRDREESVFNRWVRRSCSKFCVRSVALNSRRGLGGRGGGGGALRGGPL